MLIAAYAHDAGHAGYRNDFYLNTSHKLTIIYGNRSPL